MDTPRRLASISGALSWCVFGSADCASAQANPRTRTHNKPFIMNFDERLDNGQQSWTPTLESASVRVLILINWPLILPFSRPRACAQNSACGEHEQRKQSHGLTCSFSAASLLAERPGPADQKLAPARARREAKRALAVRAHKSNYSRSMACRTGGGRPRARVSASQAATEHHLASTLESVFVLAHTPQNHLKGGRAPPPSREKLFLLEPSLSPQESCLFVCLFAGWPAFLGASICLTIVEWSPLRARLLFLI